MFFLPAAYYRGAMGILLIYDVGDESSFNNVRNWMRNIEQHASNNVNKVSFQHRRILFPGITKQGNNGWAMYARHWC